MVSGCDEWVRPKEGKFGAAWWADQAATSGSAAPGEQADTSPSMSTAASASAGTGDADDGDWRDDYGVPSLEECGYDPDADDGDWRDDYGVPSLEECGYDPDEDEDEDGSGPAKGGDASGGTASASRASSGAGGGGELPAAVGAAATVP